MKNIIALFGMVLLVTTSSAFADDVSSIPPRFTPPATTGAPSAPNPYQQQSMPTAPAAGGQNYAPQAGAQTNSMDTQAAVNSQQEQQGNYPALDRSTGVPLGMIQPAWSKPFKNMAPGQGSPGVVRFDWSSDLIMPVRIRDYMITTVVFPKWEKITDVFIGESQYLEGTIMRANVIGLRSSHSGIDTTVTALGESGNIYTFYIRAEGYNTKKLTDINVFVNASQENSQSAWFKGGMGDTANGAARPSKVAHRDDWKSDEQPDLSSMSPPFIPGASSSDGNNMSLNPQGSAQAGDFPAVPRKQMIFDMKMYEAKPGDGSIAPEYIYTDGVWTYFQYSEKAKSVDWPIVYRVVDGTETRVNTRTAGAHGNVLIAEAVGDFSLRNGQKVVCVKRDSSLDKTASR